jgi:hypothetical protein
MISYEVSVDRGVRLAAGAPILVMLVVLFALAAAAPLRRWYLARAVAR